MLLTDVPNVSANSFIIVSAHFLPGWDTGREHSVDLNMSIILMNDDRVAL